jgi:AraC-like DNA-binding protein
MDLMWLGDELVIAGPDTQAFSHSTPAGTRLTGLRFAPGYGPFVFGAPAREFVNERVPLDALWKRDKVRRIGDEIVERGAGEVLEDVALREASTTATDWSFITTIARDAQRGVSVERIAESVGVSARQLQRRALHAFGYGPKMLARILRLVRALDLARAGTPFAEVAATTGYADQAHLSRDVREFSGASLGQLVAPVSSAANKSTAFPSGSRTTA